MAKTKRFMATKEMEIEGLGVVSPGVQVRHPVFGIGEIKLLAAFPDGSQTVQVEFADQSTKWLVPA